MAGTSAARSRGDDRGARPAAPDVAPDRRRGVHSERGEWLSKADAAARHHRPFDPSPSASFGAEVLRGAEVPAALIGRVAVWQYVPPEHQAFTKDVNFAVAREHMPKLRRWLSDQGIETLEVPVGGVGIRREEPALRVDFIDRTDPGEGDLGALYAAAVEDALRGGETVRVESHDLPVVAVDYLVAMKFATGRVRDKEDADRLLIHGGADVDAVRRLVREHLGPAAIGHFEQFLREIGHAGAHPRGPYPRPKRDA